MTLSEIAEIKERAFARIDMDSDYNRRVIELCEEVERLQKELTEARRLIDMAAGALADCYDVKEWPADNECRQAVALKALLASSQGQG